MATEQMNLNIKVDELEDYLCPKCQGIQWAPVFKIKVIGAIQSPTGKAGSLHHQIGFMCTSCGWADSIQHIAQECKAIAANTKVIIETPFTVVKGGGES